MHNFIDVPLPQRKKPTIAFVFVLASACSSGGNSEPDARIAARIDAQVSVVDANVAVPDAMILPDAPPAVSEYNAEHCAMVADTLNIHWAGVGGVEYCTGIEITDGNPADAMANGTVVLNGVSVTNEDCIANSVYDFTISEDGLRLTGADTNSVVAMILKREPHEACFVGHWVDAPFDYLAHISATAWGITPETP
jgi:hypothetical protein